MCDETKPLRCFHRQAKGRLGRSAKCSRCRNRIERDRRAALAKETMVSRARTRANKAGIPFEITAADIVIPTHCPVLGIPLIQGRGRPEPGSPSLDRIVAERGYVPGNIVVISNRANTLKRDATPAELRAIAVFYSTQV